MENLRLQTFKLCLWQLWRAVRSENFCRDTFGFLQIKISGRDIFTESDHNITRALMRNLPRDAYCVSITEAIEFDGLIIRLIHQSFPKLETPLSEIKMISWRDEYSLQVFAKAALGESDGRDSGLSEDRKGEKVGGEPEGSVPR